MDSEAPKYVRSGIHKYILFYYILRLHVSQRRPLKHFKCQCSLLSARRTEVKAYLQGVSPLISWGLSHFGRQAFMSRI